MNLNLSSGKKKSMPDFLAPQLATLVKSIPKGNNWIYEIKFDGYRILAFIKKNKIKLMTRNINDLSEKFPTFIKALQDFNLENAILDGELVALNKQGRSSFQLLQDALMFDKKINLAYFVFDILYYKNVDLCNLSLNERQAILKKIIKNNKNSIVQLSTVLTGDPKVLLKSACKKNFEGLMAKDKNSIYQHKRTRTWLKLKCTHEQEFVIVGFTKPGGKRAYFGALLLGYFDKNKKLHYVSKVGTGFTERTLKVIYQKMKKLIITKPSFAKKPDIIGIKSVTWIKPQLVGEVAFTEWTKAGGLRHPAFKGLRFDKKAIDVTKEVEK